MNDHDTFTDLFPASCVEIGHGTMYTHEITYAYPAIILKTGPDPRYGGLAKRHTPTTIWLPHTDNGEIQPTAYHIRCRCRRRRGTGHLRITHVTKPTTLPIHWLFNPTRREYDL